MSPPSADVLHEPVYGRIVAVPGGGPERARGGLGPDDQGRDTAASLHREATLPLPNERSGDPLSSRGRRHREPVQVAAPAVPPHDERSDDAAVVLGHEQGFGVARDQPVNVLNAILDR